MESKEITITRDNRNKETEKIFHDVFEHKLNKKKNKKNKEVKFVACGSCTWVFAVESFVLFSPSGFWCLQHQHRCTAVEVVYHRRILELFVGAPWLFFIFFAEVVYRRLPLLRWRSTHTQFPRNTDEDRVMEIVEERKPELSMKDIPVTLWGTNAEGFDEKNVIDLARKEPLIAILTAMTVRAFKGETTLSSTSATRIYLNLDTEDVHAFRSRLAYPLEVTTLAQSPEDKQSHVNAAISSRKTIYELLRLDRFADLGKKFICEATIKEIDASRGWWYNACSKCKVGVTNYDGILSCRKCGPIESLPIPWYKLDAIAADDSGEAHFFMFGKMWRSW
ncbi:hypothetical protein HS088_TW01G00522 [Tripterygium wilfordii]|uniref:Replication factor A C-terminal domain-containing protein n=1 Tax=Tripterygium wilfordii TaxID=458696 RepID=A0A7J7E1Z5_TRIWF|nr:hypothetical protein HS088_TW01G00522 [Tripterygium wilfordii]